jgi:hypothetical protein
MVYLVYPKHHEALALLGRSVTYSLKA